MSHPADDAALAVIVPVLARPHRVTPLVEAFTATSPRHHMLFVVDSDDYDEIAEIEAVQQAGAGHVTLLDTGARGYARKINLGIAHARGTYLFLGADDLVPQSGWFEAACSAMRDGVEVVGVNDLIDRRPDRRGHATHFLMTRRYAQQPTIDGRPGPLCEAYDHSWIDNEMVATAIKRGIYAYCEDSHVRHDHPMVGAPDDDTYRKGRAHFRADRKIFQRRSRLWSG